ncbi:MAG: hypothetical protein L6Q84_33895 [Polyangiaceae bacterium]|nr:hypothetical protein [Polyangiaceae bacterium]
MKRSVALLVLVALAGCEGRDPMPADYPCRDAVASVASRTLACTGDDDLAEARADAFDRDYRCVDVDAENGPVEVYLHCSATIGASSCDAVKQMGDDLDAWFALSSSCASIIQRANGDPL